MPGTHHGYPRCVGFGWGEGGHTEVIQEKVVEDIVGLLSLKAFISLRKHCFFGWYASKSSCQTIKSNLLNHQPNMSQMKQVEHLLRQKPQTRWKTHGGKKFIKKGNWTNSGTPPFPTVGLLHWCWEVLDSSNKNGHPLKVLRMLELNPQVRGKFFFGFALPWFGGRKMMAIVYQFLILHPGDLTNNT